MSVLWRVVEGRHLHGEGTIVWAPLEDDPVERWEFCADGYWRPEGDSGHPGMIGVELVRSLSGPILQSVPDLPLEPAVEHAPTPYDVRRDALNAAISTLRHLYTDRMSINDYTNHRETLRRLAVEYERHLTRDQHDTTAFGDAERATTNGVQD